MEKYHLETSEAVCKEFITSAEKGLTEKEALDRLARYGANKLAESKKEGIVKKFVKQLIDPMIIVLIVAAALSLVTSIYNNESFADVFIILFVVILNSVLGVIQESKAEAAVESLKTLTTPNSKAVRGGKAAVVKSENLVPGDIILLEAGDSVPADARLIESASLKIEESALTGESVPVEKQAEALTEEKGEVSLGDRKNMVYMGSTVVYGRGTAVVCSTGMKTEMGKIADALSQAEDEKTPLQRKLSGLSKILTVLVLVICVVIFVTGIIKAGSFSFDSVISTFMLAVSLAVAAIPEGLAAVVTIVLSIGVKNMSERNAVIRKLTAVETLGCTNVICSDKTGTLTQNKMTVVEEYAVNREVLIRAMALCSDAEVDSADGNIVGEPTEAALVAYAYKEGFDKNNLKAAYPRIGEAPFDSMRKLMSTVHETEGRYIQYTKGAVDEILRKCSYILTEKGLAQMSESYRKQIMEKNKEMSDKALRVLAAAYKEYELRPEDFDADSLEQGLVFAGLYGMIDPVRPEVKAAVDKCHTAGIKVIMITGDHIDTAAAIAAELGILTEKSQAIMGSALNSMSDEELEKNIDKYRVYARVQPEHKVRIVNAWKKLGNVTAMTGDGVNDAPSIKAADIGIGMGITGTDVTKNVADMVLADDNFATIVAAVEEGRKIYANIQKTIQFLLSSNLSEVVAIFTATMAGVTLLNPAHILWINLITDSLPALSLGLEKSESDLMKHPPRDARKGIFAEGVGFDILYQGIIVAALTLISYAVGIIFDRGSLIFETSKLAMTMAFVTLSAAEIFQSFNLRSRRGSIFTLKKQNIWLWGSALAALILTVSVIFIPVLRGIFGFEAIGFGKFVLAFVIGFAVIPLVECVKFIQRKLKV